MRIEVINESAKPFRIPKKVLADIEQSVLGIKKISKNAALNIIVTTPAKSKKLNKEFRKKDYIPDVLTFRYGKNDAVMGELVVVSEVVKKQAKERKHSFADEFTILVIHGIVHMLGYEHENVSSARKASMKRVEKKLLSRLGLTVTHRSY